QSVRGVGQRTGNLVKLSSKAGRSIQQDEGIGGSSSGSGYLLRRSRRLRARSFLVLRFSSLGSLRRCRLCRRRNRLRLLSCLVSFRGRLCAGFGVCSVIDVVVVVTA